MGDFFFERLGSTFLVLQYKKRFTLIYLLSELLLTICENIDVVNKKLTFAEVSCVGQVPNLQDTAAV